MEPLYVFEDNYGHKHSLTNEISRGGQGAVYRTTDKNIAVKIGLKAEQPILNDSHNDAFNKIRLLPFPKSLNLTLPRAILKGASGYVMDLLSDMDSFEKLFNINRYEPISNKWIDAIAAQNPDCADTLARYAASGGSRRRLYLYVGFAAALAKLHCAGLVFCDVSPYNVFGSSNPEKYNVWLIDSDNVNYQEKTLKGQSAYYTPKYGALEVIEDGECSMYSDAYAFAISFFYDLTQNHPFIGKKQTELCETADDFADNIDNQLYSGYEPWIFDIEDTSNSVEQTKIPAQIILDDEMMGMLQRMFSEQGRLNPVSRPTIPEMAERIAQTADLTIRCSVCRMDSVYTGKCSWCNAEQKTLKLKSFYGTSDKRRHLWSFTREFCDSNRISVPLRLTEGFVPDNIDDTAFVVSEDGKGYLLSEFSNDAEIYAAEKGTDFKRVFGAYRLIGNSFTLKLVRRIDSRTIIIEGSVEN